MASSSGKCWLLKAEPDSRVVNGKDVKFSVDDFEAVKTSPWEGVRNYEARNLMKQMCLGDKALFYHSNCKTPGVAGFAEVSKEAYPDYTAWDPSHPYFDAKSKADDPKWFMVDLTFVSRAEHFVPLALLRYISETSTLPSEIDYIGEAGFNAIKRMDLVTRGRLSIQRVDETAWQAITMLATNGNWEDMDLKLKKGKPTTASTTPFKQTLAKTRTKRAKPTARQAKKTEEDEDEEEGEDTIYRDEDEDEYIDEEDEDEFEAPGSRGRKKRKKRDSDEEYVSPRRSTRVKRR